MSCDKTLFPALVAWKISTEYNYKCIYCYNYRSVSNEQKTYSEEKMDQITEIYYPAQAQLIKIMCVFYGRANLKEVEFYCNETDNIAETAKKLFIDIGRHDPSSMYYNRILQRPRISWIQIMLQFIIPNIVFVPVIITLLKKRAKPLMIVISCIAYCFYIILNIKKFIICAIQIYQHYAPTSIRMKCRFEPSCSQYMISAIEKYGLFKGIKIGINRLGRCRVGNGGYDFP